MCVAGALRRGVVYRCKGLGRRDMRERRREVCFVVAVEEEGGEGVVRKRGRSLGTFCGRGWT